MEDRTLSCRDCNAQLVFTASEQEFFTEKGFTNQPGRCSECRAARKATNRGGYSSGDYGSSRGREMFPAACA